MSDGGVEQDPVRKRDWISDILEAAEIVEWDRFVGPMERVGEEVIDVYGWIDRDDDHEDFVWVRFYLDSVWLEYTTSSAEYSVYLAKTLHGADEEELEDNHRSCRRVEDAFDVENAIELTEQQTLVADGGTDRSSIGIEVDPEAEKLEFEVADKRTATIGDVQYCVAGTETAIETEKFEVLEDLVSGDGPRTRIAIEMDFKESELKYHSANSGAAVKREPVTAVDLRKLNLAINLLDSDGELTLAFDHHGPLVISDHENMVVVAPIVLDDWPEFEELKEQMEGSA